MLGGAQDIVRHVWQDCQYNDEYILRADKGWFKDERAETLNWDFFDMQSADHRYTAVLLATKHLCTELAFNNLDTLLDGLSIPNTVLHVFQELLRWLTPKAKSRKPRMTLEK